VLLLIILLVEILNLSSWRKSFFI